MGKIKRTKDCAHCGRAICRCQEMFTGNQFSPFEYGERDSNWCGEIQEFDIPPEQDLVEMFSY